MFYNYQDLKKLFTKASLEWSKKFLSKVDKIHLNIQHDGELITGNIESEHTYIFSQRDKLHDLIIDSKCTCNTQHCSHIVITLLAALSQHQSDPDNPAFGNLGKPVTLYQIKVDPDKQQISITTEQGYKGSFDDYINLEPLYLNTTTLSLNNQFFDQSDLPILDYLRKHPLNRLGNNYQIKGADGAHKLQQILKTGRAFIENSKLRSICLGEPQSAKFNWKITAQGQQIAHWEVNKDCTTVAAGGIWYFNKNTAQIGPVDTHLSSHFIEFIFHHPPIEPNQVDTIQATLDSQFATENIPSLRPICFQHISDIQPIPHFTLSKQLNNKGEVENLGCLRFNYQGHLLGEGQVNSMSEDTLVNFERDEKYEKSCINLLKTYDFSPLRHPSENNQARLFSLMDDPDAWFRFQLYDKKVLQEKHWAITHHPDFDYILSEVDEWVGTLNKSADNDWFDMKLGVMINQQEINLLPILVKLVKNYPKNFDPKNLKNYDDHTPLIINLGKNHKAALPALRIRSILETLFELYQENCLTDEGTFEISRIQLLRLSELNNNDLEKFQWSGDQDEFSFVHTLRQQKGIETCKPPKGLTVTLRDYQLAGLAWLQFLRTTELSGILADDMGLGKTIQTLAHILLEKEQGRLTKPCLIIAPTSLMGNWRREANNFTPALKVLVLQGNKRKKNFPKIPDHDIILSTYPLLGRDGSALMEHTYHLLILDEAQIIKNHRTKASQTVRLIPAKHRLCLTGTPMENHLGELWSLFQFLLPGLLGTDKQFNQHFRKPIEKQHDQRRSNVLSERIRPFMLRRTKENVASELPQKTEIIRSVELIGDQRELYEVIRLSGNKAIEKEVADKGLAKSRILVLTALLKLRQVCCDPRLVKIDQAKAIKNSAKYQLLMEMLPEMIEEGRHILVFSQFTEMLALIEEGLKKARIQYAKLTGKTTNRDKQIDLFQSGKTPVFLISLKAGGVGLNLTTADVVIHYDPWWNPAVERQATDRAHRMGQENPVFVYKLITEGTVEEKIQQMQEQKQQLADSLFDDKGQATPQWTEDDLDRLFSPIK